MQAEGSVRIVGVSKGKALLREWEIREEDYQEAESSGGNTELVPRK